MGTLVEGAVGLLRLLFKDMVQFGSRRWGGEKGPPLRCKGCRVLNDAPPRVLAVWHAWGDSTVLVDRDVQYHLPPPSTKALRPSPAYMRAAESLRTTYVRLGIVVGRF